MCWCRSKTHSLVAHIQWLKYLGSRKPPINHYTTPEERTVMRHPVNPSAPASRRVAQGIVFTNDRTARHSKWSGLVSGITWPFVMFRLNSTRFSSYTRYTCYLLTSRPNTIEVNDYLPTIGKWSRHPYKIESPVVSSHSPEESITHGRTRGTSLTIQALAFVIIQTFRALAFVLALTQTVFYCLLY